MFFVNTVEPDNTPNPSRIHLLRGIELQNPLTFDEITDITNTPYSNENWSKLAYFVTKSSLRPFYHENLGRIVEQHIARGDWIINDMSVNCLFYETYFRMPSVCDWTRQFLFFTTDDFLGSLGIYALNLSTDASEYMALRQIAKVAQNQLVSNSPFNRFMVAIQRQNYWGFAFGEILPTMTPRMYTNARRVKISLFKEPSKFFYELLSGGMVNNILHEEYEIRIRI
ncbi:hypothetical protein [Metabacillus sp. B2-18]|uniref:hypothetical protein n=1 Tax=Metabacillus sp. B2-18 TaxID=2897333 RepID=UPI001E3E1964|nr:hypothetical protein [Metabacillus sp. B2-18]UGB29965.1 hypothetical protein LPC09_19935 [Metabacillus sp. B2-18]